MVDIERIVRRKTDAGSVLAWSQSLDRFGTRCCVTVETFLELSGRLDWLVDRNGSGFDLRGRCLRVPPDYP